MFDIGFSELLLFGIIALVVLGPEKLPHAARMAGAWYARIRKTVGSLQAEISAEVNAAEMRAKIEKEMAAIKEIGVQAQTQLDIVQADMSNTISSSVAGITDIHLGSTMRAKPLDPNARFYYLLQGAEQVERCPAAPLLPKPIHYV